MVMVILALVGLGLGFVAGYSWALRRAQAHVQEAQAEQTRLRELLARSEATASAQAARVIELQAAQDTLQRQLNSATAQAAKLESDLMHAQQALATRQDELLRERQQQEERFQNLSRKLLDESAAKLQAQSAAGMEGLLKPLNEQIKGFRERLENTHTDQVARNASLHEQIKSLAEANQRTNEEARNLTQALKGQAKTRGNWGEMILEKVLEQSGLTKGREYNTQVSEKSDDGSQFFLDAVIELPDQRQILVDSKVNLVAWDAYHSAADEAGRVLALSAHAKALRKHVEDLSGKQYWNLPGVKSLELILLFVPIEAAMIAALEYDLDLFHDAFDRKVVLVSPSTLLVTLRAIQNGWRVEAQNRNAQAIAEQAGRLYDKFVGFTETMDQVGKGLDTAKIAYDKARGQLLTGKDNAVRQLEKIRDMGAKAGKQLPTEWKADDE